MQFHALDVEMGWCTGDGFKPMLDALSHQCYAGRLALEVRFSSLSCVMHPPDSQRE